MALSRLTHERYDRMRTDGTWDAYCAANGVPRVPEVPAQTLTAAQRLGISDDLPAIAEAHQSWWQVRRTEVENGQRRIVLIFEHRDEERAMAVCGAQRYHCRLTKWGSKAKPYENWKPAKVIA